MHQTTVRFGVDLWDALEVECAGLGISIAQYVREAALARLAFSAGRRGHEEYAGALVAAGVPALTAAAGADAAGSRAPFGAAPEPLGARSRHPIEAAEENRSDSTALGAQNLLALQRARQVRAKSQELRVGKPPEGEQ